MVTGYTDRLPFAWQAVSGSKCLMGSDNGWGHPLELRGFRGAGRNAWAHQHRMATLQCGAPALYKLCTDSVTKFRPPAKKADRNQRPTTLQ